MKKIIFEELIKNLKEVESRKEVEDSERLRTYDLVVQLYTNDLFLNGKDKEEETK